MLITYIPSNVLMMAALMNQKSSRWGVPMILRLLGRHPCRSDSRSITRCQIWWWFKQIFRSVVIQILTSSKSKTAQITSTKMTVNISRGIIDKKLARNRLMISKYENISQVHKNRTFWSFLWDNARKGDFWSAIFWKMGWW